MAERMTVKTYLSGEETMRPQELVYGVLREPPAPNYGHQRSVLRLAELLGQHVRAGNLGRVCISPIDVVLDRDRALVVQPDVVFVSNDRMHIIQDRIWGAPDLVVEVLSPGTARRDRTVKLEWYRTYGVRECWLVDLSARQIEILDLSGVPAPPIVCREGEIVRSLVLPNLPLPVADVFED